MSEIAKFDTYKKKLQEICDENNLVFKFLKENYPIKLVIRPTNGVYEQMSMLENLERNGYTSPNAYIIFTMKEGAITYKTSETFTISDALFTKIKNLFKNMHYSWLQYFFASLVQNKVLAKSMFPKDSDFDTNESEVDSPNDEEITDESIYLDSIQEELDYE